MHAIDDQVSADFLEWFTNHKATSLHADLQLADLRARGAGRGIVARANIPASTPLFTIPRSILLSTSTSDLPRRLPHLFDPSAPWSQDESVSSESRWLELILVLIYEHVRAAEPGSTRSKWSSYLNILPTSFDTPLFWTEDELAELRGSDLRNRIGKQNADSMLTKYIVATVLRHRDIFFPHPENCLNEADLLSLAHRFGSTIMAYAFDLTPSDDDSDSPEASDEQDGWVEDRTEASALAMVPMADMLNADAEFNAYLNHEEDALVMTSLRAIEAGEEVLNYYGPLPTSDLVRRYGYCSPKHERYDVVEIDGPKILEILRQEVQDPRWRNTLNDVSTLNAWLDGVAEFIGEEEVFTIERDTDDCGPGEDGRFVKEPRKLTSTLHELRSSMVTLAPSSAKAAVKELFATVVSVVIADRLAEYDTPTSAQDERLIAGGGLSHRHHMAVRVRMGEKKLLEAFAASLEPRGQSIVSNGHDAIERKRKAAAEAMDGAQTKTMKR